MPGTTGGYENVSAEALTFIEFPTAGIYTMGVNSDDGFRVTVADRTGPDFGALRVVKPAAAAGYYPGWATYSANGGLFGGPWPRPYPFVRPLVKANDGTTADDIADLNSGNANASYTFLRSPPTNATELAGNIAVARRGGDIPFVQKARYCQDAGAIAVIIVDRPDVATELPFGMGGSDAGVTIPCILIQWQEYSNFWNYVTTKASTTGVTLGVGEDCSPMLAQYDAGRGQGSPTIFSFYVPQAGVYPMRLLWVNYGGGANCEWFTVDSAGTYTLINDATTPGSLKAYRARTVATRGRLNPPSISGNNVTISWTPTGELEEADSLSGPWVKSPSQASPQTRAASESMKYFRLRVY